MKFKRYRNKAGIILSSVFLYLCAKMSYREIEFNLTLQENKIHHTTVFRWIQTFSKKLVYNFKRRKRLIGDSWYVDETYIEVNKKWVYLYRAVDKSGKTVHFYLSEIRNLRAARKFLIDAIKLHGKPEKITVDLSGSNIAAIDSINDKLKNKDKIEKRTSKYLNNRIEQDHRKIKQKFKQTLGFKNFKTAEITIYGIEVVHALRKEFYKTRDNYAQMVFQEFCRLAA